MTVYVKLSDGWTVYVQLFNGWTVDVQLSLGWTVYIQLSDGRTVYVQRSNGQTVFVIMSDHWTAYVQLSNANCPRVVQWTVDILKSSSSLSVIRPVLYQREIKLIFLKMSRNNMHFLRKKHIEKYTHFFEIFWPDHFMLSDSFNFS